MNRGFTVVEVLVTLVVMTVLLTLGVVGVRSTLVNARDAERAEDIAIIARGLEMYYKRGNPYYIGPGSSKATYPGSNTMLSIDGSGWCDTAYFKNPSEDAMFSKCGNYFDEALPGVSVKARTPPNLTGPNISHPWLAAESSNGSMLITPAMQENIDAGKYVYKPMGLSNYALCYGHNSCHRYALFYKKESTGEVVTVWSKNR